MRSSPCVPDARRRQLVRPMKAANTPLTLTDTLALPLSLPSAPHDPAPTLGLRSRVSGCPSMEAHVRDSTTTTYRPCAARAAATAAAFGSLALFRLPLSFSRLARLRTSVPGDGVRAFGAGAAVELSRGGTVEDEEGAPEASDQGPATGGYDLRSLAPLDGLGWRAAVSGHEKRESAAPFDSPASGPCSCAAWSTRSFACSSAFSYVPTRFLPPAAPSVLPGLTSSPRLRVPTPAPLAPSLVLRPPDVSEASFEVIYEAGRPGTTRRGRDVARHGRKRSRGRRCRQA